MTVLLAGEDSAHGSHNAAAAIKANGHLQAANGVAATGGSSACGPPPEEAPLQPGSEEYKRHLPVTEVLELDKGTKDEWIPRWVLRRQSAVHQPPPPAHAFVGGCRARRCRLLAFERSAAGGAGSGLQT